MRFPCVANIGVVFCSLPAAGGAAAILIVRILMIVIGSNRNKISAVYLLKFILIQFFLSRFLLLVFRLEKLFITDTEAKEFSLPLSAFLLHIRYIPGSWRCSASFSLRRFRR